MSKRKPRITKITAENIDMFGIFLAVIGIAVDALIFFAIIYGWEVARK